MIVCDRCRKKPENCERWIVALFHTETEVNKNVYFNGHLCDGCKGSLQAFLKTILSDWASPPEKAR